MRSSLIAQLVERETVNLEVVGSIPLGEDFHFGVFCTDVRGETSLEIELHMMVLNRVHVLR